MMQLGRLPLASARPHVPLTAKNVKLAPNVEACRKCKGRAFHGSSTALDGGEPPKRKTSIDKDFFISVLGASATKRDAKGYLSRFTPAKGSKNKEDGVTPYARGVNLGGLYTSPRAVAQAPLFTQDPAATREIHSDLKIHVAIVVLRNPQSLKDNELKGVAITLGQLARLGLPSALILDPGEELAQEIDLRQWREKVLFQANRLVSAIQRDGKSGAQILDQTLGHFTKPQTTPRDTRPDGYVRVNYGAMLSTALQNGIIPIIPPIAYSARQQAMRVSADEVALALTRKFVGLDYDRASHHDHTPHDRMASRESDAENSGFLLDRIIILDSNGGLPARDRKDSAHIFINLEQEYSHIRHGLKQIVAIDQSSDSSSVDGHQLRGHTALGTSNPFSVFVEDELPPEKRTLAKERGAMSPVASRSTHLQNLDVMQRTLALLSPASSGLIIRPQEVATAALNSRRESSVGTRQYRNPLIHNLLTDKPIISSSLPSGRLGTSSSTTSVGHDLDSVLPHATFLKRGMPITIIPDPNITPWSPPGASGTTLTLEDPRIDFQQLLHLIEDSFGRKLDVNHYLRRVESKLAGIIVAGEYEGGAILTWEKPPGIAGRDRPPVPYLDKFAVLKRSQGAGGVADIVFNAMVRTCFPEGVVWRSRKNNPVNRWYFERADGTWKIPDTQWTMFWTGNELWNGYSGTEISKRERWKDYVGVCQNIEASWADTKAPD